MNKKIFTKLSLLALVVAPGRAFAATSLPWEAPITSIVSSIQGPVAMGVSTVAIIGAGIGLSLSEGGGIARKLIWLVMGLSLVFGAVTLINTLFTPSGGVTF